MANKRITELASASNLTVNDLLVLVNDAQTRKATIGDLITFLIAQGEFAQLDNGTIPPAQLPALSTTTVTEGTNKYYTAARVLAELLAGFNAQNSVVTSADSVVTAFGKLQGQVNASEKTANRNAPGGYAGLDTTGKIFAAQLPSSVLGSVSYQGSWNAASSLPAASPANKGWYYVVTANGTQSVDGISEWKISDWVISNGTTWQKVDNSDPGILEPLSGFVTGANSTILATDTVLSAFQKTQGQINAGEKTANRGLANGYASLDNGGKVPAAQLPGVVIYQGSWAAATALPAASASNKGWYYVVSANGTQTVDGISEWAVGDWAISNGTVWQKVDNSDLGTAAVLTGFATGANSTILATDTILSALQKVQGQITAREEVSKKGLANGYASLDGLARLPKAQLTKGTRPLILAASGGSASGTAETKVHSSPINTGILSANDQLNITAWFSATANANVKTIKLYVNTSDAVGGTLLGTYTVPATSGSFKFERQITFPTATSAKAGSAPTTSSLNGESGALEAAFTVPNINTNTLYYVISATKAVSGDTLRCDRVLMEPLFWSASDPVLLPG